MGSGPGVVIGFSGAFPHSRRCRPRFLRACLIWMICRTIMIAASTSDVETFSPTTSSLLL